MTFFKHGILLLAFAVKPSFANLLDLESVTSQIEDVNQTISERVSDIKTEKIKPITNQTHIKVDNLASEIINLELITPVTELAKKMDVRDRQGNLLYQDVEVENGWRAIAQQWLAWFTLAELRQFNRAVAELNIHIQAQESFPSLGLNLVKFQVPASYDSYQKLSKTLPSHLMNKIDRNHVYTAQNAETTASSTQENLNQNRQVCDDRIKLGMVDTAINTKHLALAQSQIIQQSFLAENIQTPQAHGTAVAALLVSSSPVIPALTPNAQLYSAAVFHPQGKYAQGAALINLIKGLDWLIQQDVKVINMSLAGPDNSVLAQAVKLAHSQQVTIVAAVGNQGPSAPPMYPAAYPQVIAVTAVDKQAGIYRWANRGEYVDFAAVGVAVKTARGEGEFGAESGTSIATPVVTAYVACEKLAQRNSNFYQTLIQKVTDLGPPGKDSIYGYGLLSQ
ncbi:S8 family serine peptidase [Catenovulum maritimum]|uniref:S8 family serine peptidase n=1 Tax=Catenovulum maritimum TaxID=1513271 RepID=UPI000661482D|nr:S8 family serine peptidase [Catenovulum maritimum]